MRDNNSIIKIKFLMNMFEGMVDSGIPNGVEQFKSVINNMTNQGQIEPSLSTLVKRVYGIENTNTFKPAVQSEKVAQIKNTMNYVEQLATQGYNETMIKQQVGLLVSNKMISKTAGDIVTDIYFSTDNSVTEITKPAIKLGTDNKHVNSPKDIRHLLIGRELTISELRRLSKDELLTLHKFYRKLSNDRRYDNKICEFFKDIAYYETTYMDTDPCSGGIRYTRRSVNKCENIPSNYKIVYECDNRDSCAASTYLVFAIFISRQLNKIENILKNM